MIVDLMHNGYSIDQLKKYQDEDIKKLHREIMLSPLKGKKYETPRRAIQGTSTALYNRSMEIHNGKIG